VLVVRRATFTCFETNDAGMMREESVDPPPGKNVSVQCRSLVPIDSLSSLEAQISEPMRTLRMYLLGTCRGPPLE
jgi:hypothetical protein